MGKINKNMIARMKKLKKKGLKIEKISKLLGISARSIQRYTVDFPHPKRKILIPLPESAIGLTKEKAEIIGLLCAEGCDFDRDQLYYEYDYRRNNTYRRIYKESRIEFSNLNKTLQNHFQHLMWIVYKYKPTLTGNGNMKIYRKNIINDLRSYTRFGSHKWNVPNSIMSSNSDIIKLYFCRGYFDGDGSVNIKRKEIEADSVNGSALENVQELLRSTDISSRLKHYKNRSRIMIRDLKKFYKVANLIHLEKRKKLRKIVGSK